MLRIIDHSNIAGAENRAFMDQAFRLRHEVFVGQSGWEDLRKPDGREMDQFDDARAVHMLLIEDGTVIGYQRMLPTLQTHLLSEVLSQLCDGPPPRGAHIWEWTRYCVAREHRERGRKLSYAANVLLSGIVEWGQANGVSEIVIEMDPLWLLRLVQLHFRIRPLGFPQSVNGKDTMAVVAEFNDKTLARLRDVRGDRQRVAPREREALTWQ